MPTESVSRDTLDQKQLLAVLMAFKKGDFSVRMPLDQTGIAGKIADTLNDVIEMKTLAGESRYAVTETKIVRPSDIGVLARVPGRDLTLVTCYPFYYIGSAPERFIVHARKVG